VSGRSRSLASRAALAVALFVGFYAMGIALVLALLWVPWAQVRYEDGVDVSGVACTVFAIWIAIALLPRFGQRKPIEPPLPTNAHAKLRRLIAQTAREIGEPPPDELYVLASVNAFAGRRGGFLGYGGRSMIGIGLPLLSALEEDELRAVIAHELGHHHAGDLMLGPWVHRTRIAVSTALSRLEGASLALHLPFALYARVFLRLTLQASRDQELAADALAGRVAGQDAAARALIGVDRLAPRWGAYFSGEVLPLLQGGRRPPLLDGFRRFLAQPVLREDVQRTIERLGERDDDADHTHPPLRERLASLDSTRVTRPPPTASALALLDSVDRAESDALDVVLMPGHPPLTAIGWDAAGEAWLSMWRARMRTEPRLEKADVLALPRLLRDAANEPAQRGISLLSPAAKRKLFADLAGVRLAVALADLGFRIEAPPGGETRAIKDEHVLEPEALVRKLAAGTIDERAYRAALAEAGVMSLLAS
jgi:Zn-dependent protease with chaperone function